MENVNTSKRVKFQDVEHKIKNYIWDLKFGYIKYVGTICIVVLLFQCPEFMCVT